VALSCSDEKTIVVDAKCPGVVTTASVTTLVQGEVVLLRVTGCDRAVNWQEGYPVGTTIGNQPALVVSPRLTTTYTVSCQNQGGKTCVASTGEITVTPNCSNFQLSANSISSDKRKNTEVLIKAIGCSGRVDWEKIRGNDNLNLDIINETTLNVTNIKYSFIIKATCTPTGCIVTGDYPAPPHASFPDNTVPYCSYQHVNLKLANENSTSLTLQLVNTSQNILSGFTWDDNSGNTETPRSFNRPKTPTVFSATYQNGKCKVSYIYQPNRPEPWRYPVLTSPWHQPASGSRFPIQPPLSPSYSQPTDAAMALPRVTSPGKYSMERRKHPLESIRPGNSPIPLPISRLTNR
jgi:hypothetical protein